MNVVCDFGQVNDKDRVGGKGAGLTDMIRLGLPVPPGFTVTTEACLAFGGDLDGAVWDEVVAAMRRLEAATGRSFGGVDGRVPLLVSVRSGSKHSMPGMMDTVLNLGINDQVAEQLAGWSGRPRFAWGAYRRFLQMYGHVVLGIPNEPFGAVMEEARASRRAATDADLTAEDLAEAVARFVEIIRDRSGAPVPADPWQQLREAIGAVFGSWDNRRARDYRELHGIPHDLGTAANVQMMVFGDLDDESGTGVAFTRDPANGSPVPYGDYLADAQGEDVVAGIRNTLTLDELAALLPDRHAELLGVMRVLEGHYADMCDIEFTIERGKLWILQTRVGKRTAPAAVRMAVDMVDEGLIDVATGLGRVDPASLEQLQRPRIDERSAGPAVTEGVAASPGAAAGVAVFDSDRAVELAADGIRVILVRIETAPDDIHGMAAAQGILTSRGGKTSHAAVVARGMGKPAVTGAPIEVDEKAGRVAVGNVVVREGDFLTIDGTSGRVYAAAVPLVEPTPTPALARLLDWADATRRLGVRANADTAEDAAHARAWGAEGIGLARTEHMFLGERLAIVQQVILDADPDRRKEALERLRGLQVEDFEGLLSAMDGLPVIVRLLDPPLHEFLPDRTELHAEMARLRAAGEVPDDLTPVIEAVDRLAERNPMLGMRGVRLGVMFPEIYDVQVEAAVEAVRRRMAAGGDPRLEIMVPLVSTADELRVSRERIDAIVAGARLGRDIPVGTMIEIPRAALTAGEVARHADFFSFGTNDLTQTTFGLSRDDVEGSFMPTYLRQKLFPWDPFQSLDREGVGRLIRLAVSEGRQTRAGLSVGICGEHGGDPDSIAFCQDAGVDYVSCSPYRVPVARLAAAQAALGADRADHHGTA